MARSTLYAFAPQDDEEEKLGSLLDDSDLPVVAQQASPQDPAPSASGDDALLQMAGFKPPTIDDGHEMKLLAPLLEDREMSRGAEPTARIDAGAARAMQGPSNDDDPELSVARRKAELSALNAANMDNDYGWVEALRDNGGAALASVLDIGFNKGRGLGGIVQASAGEVARQQDARAKRAAEAGKLAVELRGKVQDPVLVELQRQRIENARVAEEGRGKRFDTNVQRQDDPTSQHNMTREEMAQRVRQAQLDADHAQAPITAQDAGARAAAEQAARLGTAHEYAPITAGDAAAQAGAETGARIGTTLGYAPQTTAAEAARAAAVEEAKIPAKIAEADQMTPILNQRGNSGVGQGLDAELLAKDNPYLDFGDKKQLQNALKTRAINQKTLEDIKAANRGSEIIDRLHDTAAEYQSLTPLEMAGNKGAKLRRQYDAHAEEYAGVLGKLSGSASEASRKQALDLVPSIHNPLATAGIEGLYSSIEANTAGNLGTLGIKSMPPRFMRGSTQAPGTPQPVAAPQVPGNTMPSYGHDLSTEGLGATHGRVPRVPVRGATPSAAAPAPAGQTFTLIKPDGTPVKTSQSMQEIQAAIADGRLKGWKVGN